MFNSGSVFNWRCRMSIHKCFVAVVAADVKTFAGLVFWLICSVPLLVGPQTNEQMNINAFTEYGLDLLYM